MKEREKYHTEDVKEISKEDFERYDLVHWLGNHFNSEGVGVIRDDLKWRAKRYVKRHVVFHLNHDRPNPNNKKRIKAINEVQAVVFPALRDPVGVAVATIAKHNLNKSHGRVKFFI